MSSTPFPTVGSTGWGASHGTLQSYIDAVGVSVTQFGAVGDGVTDDSGAFTTALALARRVIVPKPASSYLLSSQVTVAGQLLEGEGYASSITGKGFILGDNGVIKGLRFVGANTASTYGVDFSNAGTVAGWMVTQCYFESYLQAINVRATVTAGTQERGWITDNRFTDCNNSILAPRVRRVTIARNISVTSVSAASHFVLYGAEYCRITDNYISGGTAGILLLARWDLNGTACGFVGNVITGNTVEGCTQESISLDCNGSTAATIGVRELDTVASTAISGSSYNVTLSSAAWAGSSTSYVGAYVVWVSGANIGQAARIIVQSHAQLTIDTTRTFWNGVAAGDQVAIGHPFLANTITGNTIDARSSSTEGIYLYGFCICNTVTGNTVRGKGPGGIIVATLNGLVPASTSVVGGNLTAPSGGNTITGNTVTHADVAATYKDYAASTVGIWPPNTVSGNGITYANGNPLSVDSFFRASSTTSMIQADTGQPWEPKNSVVAGINTNQAYLVTNGTAGQHVTAVNAGKADVLVEATLSDPTTSGLALRVTDGDNCLYTTATTLVKRVSAVDTVLSTFSTTLAAGDRLGVRAVGNTYTIYQNGVTVGTATDSYNATQIRHGLRWAASSSAKMTAFRVSDIATAPVSTSTILPAEVSVTNSVTETALFTSTIPAGSLAVGTTYRVTIGLFCDVIATSGTLIVRLRWGGVGGTSICGGTIPSSASLQTGRPVWIEYLMTCRSTGATGSVVTSGNLRGEIGAGQAIALGGTTTTIDTTTAKDLAFTAQWATANTGNTARIVVGSVELVKP